MHGTATEALKPTLRNSSPVAELNSNNEVVSWQNIHSEPPLRATSAMMDVVIEAPVPTKPIRGVENVLHIVQQAIKIAGPIRYTHEVRDSKQTMLFWDGKAREFSLQAVTILVDDENGLIREVRVLMRPWPVVTIFRNAMHDALAAAIPESYWELHTKPAASAEARKFTPIALKPIGLAADVTLHSPMLAKSVRGKAEVEAALHLAHQIQSASSYTSIIATPDLLIELFDRDVDGYPMEGIWVQELNGQGEIEDLTVYLRPYPAVTVLRNGAKELGQRTGTLVGDEYWELPALAGVSAHQADN
jgi:hypothetical protein